MKQKGNIFIITAIVLALIAGIVIYFRLGLNPATPKTQILYSPPPKVIQNNSTSSADLKSYTSSDLKISFKYPKGWSAEEKGREILISSYKTYIGENKIPRNNQIKLFLNEASLCQKTLDQDVLLGGCGEGQNSRNEILFKESKEFSGGSFIIYKIKYPTGEKDTFYYFQKNDRILEISKQPDPSQFEKEFETIINSIEFK